MNRTKPHPAILTIWRILLIIATLIPAFLNSLLFPILGTVWSIVTCAWVAGFLFFYLFYLPQRYRRMSFGLADDKLVLHGGVIYNNVTAMPLESIQFVTTASNPIDRLFGLCTVVVTAAGGRMSIPGLPGKEAKVLADIISPRNQRKDEEEENNPE